MRSNSKHTLNELVEYIRLYLEEGKSYTELKENYGLLVNQSTFH